jgi:sulfate/thiosulfate transport system permease protein
MAWLQTMFRHRPGRMPGLGLSAGISLTLLMIIVLMPMTALVLRASSLGFEGLWSLFWTARVLAALKLSFGLSLIAALVNLPFGLLLAWILVRYEFPGKRLMDAVIDLPFALPTAVAGIALSALYAPNGWLGSYLLSYGLKIAYQPAGIVVAMIFIGIPFVVRSIQPVLLEFEKECEDAAHLLGASVLQISLRVILPSIWPAALTGFILAFARAVGEYGSVIFIAGNVPMISEIAPLVIVTKLEQFDYAGAAGVGFLMLAGSFVILLVFNQFHSLISRRLGHV